MNSKKVDTNYFSKFTVSLDELEEPYKELNFFIKNVEDQNMKMKDNYKAAPTQAASSIKHSLLGKPEGMTDLELKEYTSYSSRKVWLRPAIGYPLGLEIHFYIESGGVEHILQPKKGEAINLELGSGQWVPYEGQAIEPAMTIPWIWQEPFTKALDKTKELQARFDSLCEKYDILKQAFDTLTKTYHHKPV